MRSFLKTKSRELILLAVLAVIAVVATSITPAFIRRLNIINILNNNATLGVMAMGMMVVIVTGNIDVSVGAQYAVAGMVVALFAKATNGQQVVPAVLLGMLTGMVLGLFNGILIAKLNIPAIVVTLGTLSIMRGVLNLITSGNWVDGLGGPFGKFANIRILGYPLAVHIWILVVVLTALLLYGTKWGRDILCVGGNKMAAQRLGISQTKAYLLSFAYSGALAGLAAAIAASKLKIAQPSNGTGYEMQLIAACVIGGTQFSGGIASVLGTFLGVLLLGMVDNALVLAKVPVYWQELVTGIIIILAVISGALNRGGVGRRVAKEGASDAAK